MSSIPLTVPFDDGELELPVPSRWEILANCSPKPLTALNDIESGLLQALNDPIDAASLSTLDLAQKKIAIVVDDISRPTPLHQIMPTLLNYLLRNGAVKEQLRIVTALGVHRPMSLDELKLKLGAEAPFDVQWLNHDHASDEKHVQLGTTTRGTEVRLNAELKRMDIIICVGAIEPHLLLGFGGGLKMLLPGTAHATTIAQNHMQGVTAEKYNYIGVHESPMRLDLEEAVGMLQKEIFIVNVVMNDKLEICRFFCGHPITAHRDGVKLVESHCGVSIPQKVDVVIASSHPFNADLRQGMKAMGNVEQCLKDNGLLIGLLACKGGIGDIALPPKALPNRLLRVILRAIGKNRVLWFIDKVKKDAGIEERFIAHFSMQVVRKNQIYVYSQTLPPDIGKRSGLFKQFTDLNLMMKLAAAYAPRKAKVLIFPNGGITYPRICPP